MTHQPYTLDAYVADLRRIAAGASDEDAILSQVAPLAERLARDKSWLKPAHREANPEQGFGVTLLHEEPDHSLAVFVVNWLPGRGAPPHDHGTWAVVAGVEGVERNIGYARTDDRARPDHARIEVKHETTAGPGDVICMKTGGIHEVRNEGDAIAVSLHTYGRHLNHTGRSQFDAETGEKKDFKVEVE
jgi:predicted metal-dependent enzyme (double-stranded beta helix superfamily)